MPIAIFANKTFQVSSSKIYTLDDFTTGAKLQIEEQDSVGNKPSTYIKGVSLEPISFNIPLNAVFGHDIRQEYSDWKTLQDSLTPYTFVLGNRPLSSNKFLLIGVDLTNTLLDNEGNFLKAVLQLQFKEFVRQGSAKSSNSSSDGDLDLGNYTFSADEMAYYDRLLFGGMNNQKRSNPNALAAINGGSIQSV